MNKTATCNKHVFCIFEIVIIWQIDSIPEIDSLMDFGKLGFLYLKIILLQFPDAFLRQLTIVGCLLQLKYF
jgi:hypothetical protein